MNLKKAANLGVFACSAVLGGVLFFPHISEASVIEGVRGRVVIDVDRRGEAWYVDPVLDERSYIGRPDRFFFSLRDSAIGVSDDDLARISESAELAKRLAGHVLLQVEGHGELWYVDPADSQVHYLPDPDTAVSVMTSLALGISNEDLIRVPTRGLYSRSIVNEVPFTAQAPLGNWDDPRHADSCEESSVMMAMAWVEGESIDIYDASETLGYISDFELRRWGMFADTGIADTAERILEGWYGYENYEELHGVGIDDVYEALVDGGLVVIAVDGDVLANPYFQRPYPTRHMILVTGYDAETREFITHEPGTSRGANWRYSRETIANAMRDYVSGYREPYGDPSTAMLVIRR